MGEIGVGFDKGISQKVKPHYRRSVVKQKRRVCHDYCGAIHNR